VVDSNRSAFDCRKEAFAKHLAGAARSWPNLCRDGLNVKERCTREIGEGNARGFPIAQSPSARQRPNVDWPKSNIEVESAKSRPFLDVYPEERLD